MSNNKKNKGKSCLLKCIAPVIDLVKQVKMATKYIQFKEVRRENGFLSVECPDCNEQFGLDVDYINKAGEVSYLIPYSCPYCHRQHTLKGV